MLPKLFRCRYINEVVKSLEDAFGCARIISDLFKPTVQMQLTKFREYCERLIFTGDPLLYGRKGEDLLWRKGFYEIITTAKRLKRNAYTQDEKVVIGNHINLGIGYYHHFISRLQLEYNTDTYETVDFAVPAQKNARNKRTNMCVGIFLKPSPCCTCRLLLVYNFAQGTEAVPQETQEYGI
jgi:Telomerase activating protein Est1.